MSNIISTTLPTYPSLDRVTLGDGFIPSLLRKIHTISTYDIFDKFTKEGAIENYNRVANGESGGHVGPPWYHGLICECIRGVSDILVLNYDERLDKKLDEIIDLIAKAQAADPENYINPYTTLMRPHQRWGRNGGDLMYQHELYDAGCLAEAGVHHYKATGKTALLSVAVKMTNYLADFIGDAPKHNVVASHALPEEAFLKMYRLFKDDAELSESLGARPEEYHRLAKFLIDHKGDNETRYSMPKFLGEYAQDHRPAREQRDAVGHAVRATLFYTGMAALALEDGDEELANACVSIWKDIAETKLHINGAVGAYKAEEKFGRQYYLPNNAYLETCAGVGLAFFGSEMFRMMQNASVWDVIEMTVYNVIPASVSADGVKYTYENPLESKGNFERWSWHTCPCCPPMLLKLVGYLPSLIFAEDGEKVWLNLLINSSLRRDDCTLTFKDDRMTVSTERDSVSLSLRIRVPYWTRNFAITRGGKPIELTLKDGYAVISGEFSDGDSIELTYSVPVVKYVAHPYESHDRGRVAIKHGPFLYCAESIDNGKYEVWEDLDFELSDSEPLTLNADGTVSGKRASGEDVKLIPYYSWNNRGALPMRVWFRQKGYVTDVMNTDGWEGKLYRPYAEY